MGFDIVTIGDIFIDWIVGPIEQVFLEGKMRAYVSSNVYEVSNAIILGGRFSGRRLNPAYEMERHGGGSANNSAVAATKMGVKCGIIGRVGKDEEGEYLLNQLTSFNVDVSGTKVDDMARTGVSIILLARDGTRASITYLGANANFQIGDVNCGSLRNTKVAHMTNYYLLPKMMGDDTHKLLKKIRDRGVQTSFDPGPIPIPYGTKQVRSILPALEHVDIFLPTKDEAQLITGLSSLKEIVKKFLDLGVKTVVIKMGEDGCLIGTKDETSHVPAYKVEKTVDTTGAGDVFAAAFLTRLIEGLNVKQAAVFANVAAGLKVVKKGRTAYPTKSDVEKAITYRLGDKPIL